MFRLAFGSLALVALTLGSAQTALAQDSAAQSATIEIKRSATLNSAQKQAFQAFQNDTVYYGAFWIATNGVSAVVQGVNSIEAASVLAELKCKTNGGKSCSLYAVAVPHQKAGQASVFEGLSMDQASSAVRWLKGNKRNRGGVSIAANGHYGYYAWSRRAGSDSASVRDCNRSARRNANSRLNSQEIAALEAKGLLKCKIIWSQKG